MYDRVWRRRGILEGLMLPKLLLFSNHSSHWASHSLLSWKLPNYPIHHLMFFTLLQQTWSLFYENHQSHLTYIFLYLPVCKTAPKRHEIHWTGEVVWNTVKTLKKMSVKQTCSCVSIYFSILMDINWCWMHFFGGRGGGWNHDAVEMKLSVKAFNKSFGFFSKLSLVD